MQGLPFNHRGTRVNRQYDCDSALAGGTNTAIGVPVDIGSHASNILRNGTMVPGINNNWRDFKLSCFAIKDNRAGSLWPQKQVEAMVQ
jgi:hypothetical protein